MKNGTSADTHLDLAARLRHEREIRAWSLAELSVRSGVSTAMISKVERGKSSPTAALLGRLSGAFQLTLSQLFSQAEPAAGRVSRREDQPCWRDPGSGFVRRALTPAAAPSPLELVAGELPPGARVSYPASAFTFIDQQIVVLDGTLTFIQGDASYELKEGDCLHLGPPEPCTFSNSGKKPSRYIVAVVRTQGRGAITA